MARQPGHVSAQAPKGILAVSDAEKVFVLNRIFELDIHVWNGNSWVVACPPPGIIIVFNTLMGSQNRFLHPNWRCLVHPRAVPEAMPGCF